MDNIFAKRLQQALERNNMSPAELSEQTGIRPSSISDWLNGKYKAKQDKIFILSKALGTSPSWLMGADEDPKETPERDYFTTAEDAVRFLLEQTVIMGFNGLDITKLDPQTQIDYANEILDQMKLVSYKYKDKGK